MKLNSAYEPPALSWYSGVIREEKPSYSKDNKIHHPHDKGYKYWLSSA